MQAKPLPGHPAIIKAVIHDAPGWQTPRPPNIVTFRWATAPTPTLLSPDDAAASFTTATHTMGAETLPEGVEHALNSMPVGQVARFVIPVEMMQVPGASGPWGAVGGSQGHTTMHVLLDLQAVEEVRDMTGDGRVWLPLFRALPCNSIEHGCVWGSL